MRKARWDENRNSSFLGIVKYLKTKQKLIKEFVIFIR